MTRSDLSRPSRFRRLLVEERATAIVEFAFVAPFLFAVFAGLVDVSFLLINYAKVEQAAREGVRQASRMPLIIAFNDPGVQTVHNPWFENHDSAGNLDRCDDPVPPTYGAEGIDCAHAIAQFRIRQVLQHERMLGVGFLHPDLSPTEGPAEISTSFERPPAGALPADAQDSIRVRIETEYRGFFGTWPITVSYQGPWMYQNL